MEHYYYTRPIVVPLKSTSQTFFDLFKIYLGFIGAYGIKAFKITTHLSILWKPNLSILLNYKVDNFGLNRISVVSLS